MSLRVFSNKMTTQLPIQTVFDASGQAVSVIVPIELWRQIAPQAEAAPDEIEARVAIWAKLRGSMPQLTPTEQLMAEKRAETEREEAQFDARL